MRKIGKLVAIGVGAGLVGLCAACSPEAAIYGSEGATVRAVSNDFISEVASSGQSDNLCSGTDVDLGSATSWEGMSAGEPEEYDGKQWNEYEALSPTWFINVSQSQPAEGVSNQDVPAVIFYRGDGDDLCIAGVAWGTLTTS